MVKEINQLFKDKRIAVIGGLGSIGSEIINKLLECEVCSIVLADNRETELAYWLNNISDSRIKFRFCDVREYARVLEILKNIDIVFHASAMKHVTVSEFNPFEAVKTNVIGTQNIIEASLRNEVEKMILISTDKAVNPTNVMGATKLLAERLVSAVCSSREELDTKFGVVRFGNVLHSRGSVLEIWEEQVKCGKKITITDPNMTRFFMDVGQSVYLIFEATKYAKNGETFILKMPSVRIGDLADVYLKLKKCQKNHFMIIGKKPGEKMHEELIFPEEADALLENDKFLLRLPFFFKKDARRIQGFKPVKKTKYSSDDPDNLLDKEQIEMTLRRSLRLNDLRC